MKADPLALTFDLQKAHVLPVLTTNKAYYKHQLTLYNEGLHDMSENQGYAHLWTENIVKRGSQEIASVIYRFVKKYCCRKQSLSFWCDNCGRQNKNQFVAMAMIYMVNTIEDLQVVDIRFPYKGHTFLPDDSNFGIIEKKIQAKELLYTVDDYVEAMSKCNSYRKEKKGEKKKLKRSML